MLRNVVGDYLENLRRERDLDLPLLLLLSAMGFYDVHLTHGTVEFGKDFIAKKRQEGLEIQYSFQSKLGDINQYQWRSELQGQLLESVVSTLSHPNFSTSIPHQSVLILTGDLKGNAGLGLQDLNNTIENSYGKRPIIVWSRENLIDHLVENGLEPMLQTSAASFLEQGRFMIQYGRALQGLLSSKEIERHSRDLINLAPQADFQLLRATLELQALSLATAKNGQLYEAIHSKLALIRTLCALTYAETDQEQLQTYLASAVRDLNDMCFEYVRDVESTWNQTRDFLDVGPLDITTYAVHCSRILEVVGLTYFTASTQGMRDHLVDFMTDFIVAEPGCAHPVSDRYAVPIVMAALVLIRSQRTDILSDLLTRTVVWLCDRYEAGMGLANVDSDPLVETETLLGSAFEFIKIEDSKTSFLATVLGDVAAFLGDPQLYAGIVNDIKACDIHPEYWQVSDSIGSCQYESSDVIQYPSIRFEDDLDELTDFQYADHLLHEYSSFRFTDQLGCETAIFIAALLRDRYFPKLWPELVQS